MNMFDTTAIQTITADGNPTIHIEPCLLQTMSGPTQYLVRTTGSSTQFYRWQTNLFVPIAHGFPSDAYTSRCFKVGGVDYLALGRRPSLGVTNVYMWNSTSSVFSLVQSIGNQLGSDYTPTAIKDFTIGNTVYLAVAQSDSGGAAAAPSRIWKWDTLSMSFLPAGLLPSAIASDVEAFTIDSITYLVLTVNNVGVSPSLFFRYNPNLATFDQIGTISAQGGQGHSTVKSVMLDSKRHFFVGYQAFPYSYLFQLI